MNKPTVKYNAVFEKKGDLVYISHLDLMTLFRRAIRRTSLPFVISQGFTPRVKISMPMALKLGVESLSEEMFLWMTEETDPSLIVKEINGQLPEGVKLSEAQKAEKKKKKG